MPPFDPEGPTVRRIRLMNEPAASIEFSGYSPGAIGRITELHGLYYSRNWDLGLFFEAKVAAELSEFLQRFDPSADFFSIAQVNDHIVGSIVVDGSNLNEESARLRWFIVDPQYHGWGIGRRLISEAVDFCRQAGHPRLYLWTFEGLDTARHLYESFGFRLIDQHSFDQWGAVLNEQKFVLDL
jgi:GNAT superfamily N-acetyltransferase